MAGNTILSILAKLGLDASDFHKGLGDAESKATSSGSKIANNLAAVGGGIVTGGLMAAGAAVAAVGGYLASAVGPASDLAETVSKVGVVFGDWGEDMLHWGETSATALGMSTNAALGAAATYGNLFRAMGIGVEASYDMSTGLVELAADLASFNNMDPTMVLDKLRAGLSGETEPLKTLGVILNASTI